MSVSFGVSFQILGTPALQLDGPETGPASERMDVSSDTLVIGLGNLLRGDDGVGIRVIQSLTGQKLPDGVEVVDGGTQGLGIVSLMEGRKRVIVVDAANVGKAPGEFACFTPADARLLGDDEHLTIHGAGLRDALLLAQALQVLPDDVVIVGVQPANLDWDDDLSPEVEAAIPQIVGRILDELEASSF
jgi:hydrogenase maturation protease